MVFISIRRYLRAVKVSDKIAALRLLLQVSYILRRKFYDLKFGGPDGNADLSSESRLVQSGRLGLIYRVPFQPFPELMRMER